MPRQRLGVVLLIPQPLATEIDGVRRAIGDADRERIPPHLTLVPPVNVHDRDLLAALDVLRDAAQASRPFTLTIGPAATFAPVTPTLYLAVGGALEELEALRARVFRGPLHRNVEHPFVPHVTLDADHAPDRADSSVAALNGFEVAVTFDRVHALREGDDRVWRPFADAPFGPPAVVGRGGLPVELTVSARPDAEAAALLAIDGEGDGRPFAVTARRDGRAVAAAWGWTGAGVLEVADLAVAATARNQGVGRRVLDAVEHVGRARECAMLTIAAPATGAAAALLAGAGWVVADAGASEGGERRLWTRRLALE